MRRYLGKRHNLGEVLDLAYDLIDGGDRGRCFSLANLFFPKLGNASGTQPDAVSKSNSRSEVVMAHRFWDPRTKICWQEKTSSSNIHLPLVMISALSLKI